MLAEFREMICQYVDVEPEKVTEDARFMEDLGFNSYDFMSLVGEVEEKYDEETNNLIIFCKTPRTRKEICEYLGLSSVTYAIQTHVMPLVESGKIKLSIPDKPKSPKQLYYSE